ncbi:MAG: DUF1116 domain-containing protein [Nitrososphaeraceae archaeon]
MAIVIQDERDYHNKLKIMNEEMKNKVEEANSIATERILKSIPLLVDVKPAIEALPNMKRNSILYAGPPIEWKRMCGAMKGAIVGTIIFEGLAHDWDEAVKLIEQDDIVFSPNTEHDAVGPMAGIISPSLPVLVVKNEKYGNTCYGRIVEQKVQYGVFNKTAINSELKFWSETLAPALRKALRRTKGINLNSIMARSLHMGDELHNRSVAGTYLFANAMLPYLIEVLDKEELLKVMKYFSNNEIFFLCTSMAACKTMMKAAHEIECSTIVTVMARNGVDFGIKVSGLGDQWFVGQAQMIDGIYLPGYKREDANPDMGDSAIIETAGIGAFALANSPAIMSLIGGSAKDLIKHTNDMREITVTPNERFSIPILDFQGIATGIDIRKVMETGILPVIDSAIAHKKAGVGMIGAGLVNPPLEVFKQALHTFNRKYKL